MKATDDINSNSVLEVNNIIDSDGKPDDDEPEPVFKNEPKKNIKNKKSEKPSNASQGLMLIKDEKQGKDISTQITPRPEKNKVMKKDFGVTVVPGKEQKHKKTNSVSVSCCTDITMGSKELTAILAASGAEAKKKKTPKPSSKPGRPIMEEFQDIEIINNNYDMKNLQKNKSKRQRSNEKQKKTKHKGSSYDSLKHNNRVGYSTPEWFANIKDERKDARTLNVDDSPRSKRRVRRSMDHYRHPDFDNYLLHQTHYYHSLNAFPKGSKFQKDMGMRGMMMKKNNFKSSLERSNFSGGMMSKHRPITNSDKSMRSKKSNNFANLVMKYNPTSKKGYPQLKSALANPKNGSLPESAQHTGRKRRANSQCGSHQKRPKSSKNIAGGRKYKAVHTHNASIENKVHSISHSIDQSSLIPHERPSSVVESLRYSKASKKKSFHPEPNKESLSTSIDVPSIELHNPDGTFQRFKHAPNNLIYKKAAELIASNFHKNIAKIPVKPSSNSQKLLRSTSRSGKVKKSKFKKNGNEKIGKKEQMHRKSKSDAKKVSQEMFKIQKERQNNYIEQLLQERVRGVEPYDRESPLGIPHGFILNQIGQNWIENINQQIEHNGKGLLDSISKVKAKNAQNLEAMNRKRRKSKQNRPQSTNYMYTGFPSTSNDTFKAILNQKVNKEFLANKNIQELENIMIFDGNSSHHNKSWNIDYAGGKKGDIEPDLTGAQISLNQR